MCPPLKENIRDLLTDKASVNLDVKAQPTPHVPGLSRHVVTSSAAALRLLEQGSRARTVGATKMNEMSSRSHSVFTLNITINYLDTKVKTVSRLNLVDRQ